MSTSIFQSTICTLETLDNLFIEMSAKNCNQRCKHCYINFPINRNVKDFISYETVKNALEDSRNFNLKCVYLTGAEPMTHPDFNNILRTCLKYACTCICTNGSFINEKKARFLRKVEDEGNNEIIFQLSIDHYNEMMNDEIRGRGTYRQVLHAIKYLSKYGFNPILNITNFYNEEEEALRKNFKKILEGINFFAEDRNISIHECFNPTNKSEENIEQKEKIISTDCKNSRILTEQGIYTCPFLANDYRGRCGSTLKDFSKKAVLESEYCNICLKNKRQMFSIDLSKFN